MNVDQVIIGLYLTIEAACQAVTQGHHAEPALGLDPDGGQCGRAVRS